MKKIIFSALTLLACLATGCSTTRNDTIKTVSNTSTITVSEADSVANLNSEASTLNLLLEKETANSQSSNKKDINQVSLVVSEEEINEHITYESSTEEVDNQTAYEFSSKEANEQTTFESSTERADNQTAYEFSSEEADEQTTFESSEVKKELAKPQDTKFTYGICIKNCEINANGEKFSLYKGQQVTICYINDTTFDIMWYPITVKVPKDCIEQYSDTFVPDFSRGQWAGCIYGKTETEAENTPKKVLTYAICKKTCTIKVDQGPTQELYIGQQIGIVSCRDNIAQILWYDTSAFVPIECIEFYPENFVPDFSKGQWAGVITK